MMTLRHLPFILLLILSGELYAEEKQCDFPTVENGRIAQYYYTFKSFYFPMSVDKKLSFFCLAGYATESGKQEEQIRCTAEGWSPNPRCYKKCLKPDLRNGYVSNDKVLYKLQERMSYGCSSGYKTTGGKDEEVVHCLSAGWSSQPSCRKEQETCLAPELEHGNYSTTQRTFKVKDIVGYTCTAGYYTTTGKQTGEAECQANGWSLTPQCNRRRNRCPPPPVPLNSKIQPHSTTYRHGERVHIECELNFVIQGSEELLCENGKWTEPPKCIEEKEKVACEQPPSVENGVAHPHSEIYYSGDKVTYRCGGGYSLRGSSTITCNRGRWTLPPECVENIENCKPPPDIANGVVVDGLLASYTTGSSVEYRCNEYYLLKGSETSRCEQGAWSSPPVCLESKGMCASPPVIRNGDIVSSAARTYENGSSVEYRCFDNHFLQGSQNAYCVDGVWTTPPSCLEPCTLSFVEMDKNYLQLKWNFDNRPLILHGEYIEFMCKRDAYISETSIAGSVLRVQCDRGRLKYPKCTPRDRRLSFQEALRTRRQMEKR